MTQEFPQLQVSAGARITATPDQLDKAERDLGINLPASYRSFAQQFGYGLLANLFRIFLPQARHGCEDLIHAGRDLAADIREAAKEDWIRYEPDGSRELVLRLVPFGKSENGDILAWDPQDQPEPGEYAIYVIGERFADVRRAAGSLYEFIERALRPNLDGMFGRMEAHLPATFVPASAGS